ELQTAHAVSQTDEQKTASVEAQVNEQKTPVAEAPPVEQQTAPAVSQTDEQKTASVEAQVDEQKTLAAETPEAPAKDQAEEKKQEPEGEISSTETYTKFHKEGGTTEVVAAGATDTDKTSEA